MLTCKLLALVATVLMVLLKNHVSEVPLERVAVSDTDLKPKELVKVGIHLAGIRIWTPEYGKMIRRKIVRKTKIERKTEIVTEQDALRVTKPFKEIFDKQFAQNTRPARESQQSLHKRESVEKPTMHTLGVLNTRKLEHVSPEKLRDTTSTEKKNSKPMSKVTLSKPSAEKDVQKIIPAMENTVRSECKYQDNVTVGQVPLVIAGHTRMELSIMVQNNRVTDALMKALATCLGNKTGTAVDDWGLFGADRFTCFIIQLEWYIFVKHDEAAQFARTVDSYIRTGSLTKCLQKSDSLFANNAAAFAGRPIVAPLNGVGHRVVGRTPAWVVGIMIGVVMIVGIITLVFMSFQADPLFHEGGPKDDNEEPADNTTQPNELVPNQSETPLPRSDSLKTLDLNNEQSNNMTLSPSWDEDMEGRALARVTVVSP